MTIGAEPEARTPGTNGESGVIGRADSGDGFANEPFHPETNLLRE